MLPSSPPWSRPLSGITPGIQRSVRFQRRVMFPHEKLSVYDKALEHR